MVAAYLRAACAVVTLAATAAGIGHHYGSSNSFGAQRQRYRRQSRCVRGNDGVVRDKSVTDIAHQSARDRRA